MMKNKAMIIRRLAAITLSGAMLMAPVVVNAQELRGLPEDFVDNRPYVEDSADSFPANDGELDVNGSFIGNNNGSIANNKGIVITNKGNISNNAGAVVYNRSEVTDNKAFVVNITGTVVNNYEDGYVFGRFYDGEAGNSKIVNNLGGTVATGYHPEDLITIENNYSGTMTQGLSKVFDNVVDHEGKIEIVNNFAEADYKDKEYVSIEKQYHAVEVTGADKVDVAYDGFTVGEKDNKQYALVEENAEPVEIAATVTLKAKDGAKLSDNGQLEGETDKLAYTLNKNDDGSYTVKITSLKGDAEISLDTLGLEVSTAKKHHKKCCHH